MRNYYNETPRDAARSEVLDWLHALARTDEDRNPHVETPSFNASKRKHIARIMYKLADQWEIDIAGEELEV